MPPAKHLQDRILVVNEFSPSKFAGCKFVWCVCCQHQKRERLIVLTNNIYDRVTRFGPSYARDVDF